MSSRLPSGPVGVAHAVDAVDTDRRGPLTLRTGGPIAALAPHVRHPVRMPGAHRRAGAWAGEGGAHSCTVTEVIVTSCTGRSLAPVGTAAITSTTARLASSATRPKMVCLPVSPVVAATEMKNWEPLVPPTTPVIGSRRLPALAIASRYGASKDSSGWISSSKV